MFVCGTVDGIIKVSGRRHNCDDLKATILAVDPIKFVYRGRYVTKLSPLRTGQPHQLLCKWNELSPANRRADSAQ